jgi:tetratricopeptide (TPR) repeat protein
MSRVLGAIALCGVVAVAWGCSDEASDVDHLDRGRRALAAGKSKEAIIEFKNAVDRDSKSGEARLQLADAYAATGQPEFAYRAYLRAADLLPDDAQAQRKAATYLLMARQFDDAAARARRALELEPESVEGQILLANALAGLHDVDAAMAYINRAIAADPTRIQSYASLAHVQVVRGRNDEALAAYRTAVTLAPQSVPARIALAAFQWSTDDRAGAQETLEVAHRLDAANLTVNRALATVYSAARRTQEAERHFRLALQTSGSDEDRMRLVDFYIARRMLKEAGETLSAARKPRAGAVEMRFARIEFLEGRVNAANDRLMRARAAEPNYAATLTMKAQQSVLQQRWDDAIWEADAAVAAEPRGAAPALYARGEAELQLRRYDAALRSYTQIVRLDPQAVDAKVALSRLHLATNEADTAMLYAQEAVNMAPQHLGARLTLIRSYLARDDDTLASNELARLPADGAKVPERFVLQAILDSKRGNVRAARAGFARALELDPTSLESLRALTALDVGRRDFDTAARRLDAALALKPEDPDLLALSARLSLARGDLQRAETALRYAVDKDPLNITSVALLTRIFAMAHRLDAVAAEFDARAARDPRDIAARIVAAVAVHTAGNLVDAERRYREVLKNEPRAAIAANNLAAIYLERGENLAEAEHFAALAVDCAPNDPEVLDTAASIALRLRQHGRAIKLYEQAVAIEPDNATRHYHLGVAYASSEDTGRARQSLGTAVRLKPDLSAAKQALSALGQ